jgi:hypothetical protein
LERECHKDSGERKEASLRSGKDKKTRKREGKEGLSSLQGHCWRKGVW